MCLEACGSNEFSETFLYIGNPDVNSVYREMTHSRWRGRKMWYEAALISDSTTHIKHHIFLELVAWHFGRPLAFGKRWEKNCDMRRHSFSSTETQSSVKCSWFYIFLTLRQFWHICCFGWMAKGGRKKFQLLVWLWCLSLLAPCSMFSPGGKVI